MDLSAFLCTATVTLLCLLGNIHGVPENCTEQSDCGWEASCVNQVCQCPTLQELHTNGKDCRNISCTNADCLQCSAPATCLRCLNFISKGSGLCLKRCTGSAELQNGNLVCTESVDDDEDNLVIAIVAGVAAGAILCIIVILAVCCYVRRTRRNVDLQNKSYGVRHMETGHVKQFPVYDNSAFENDNHFEYQPHKVDPLEYVNELEQLRPHAETLMTLLSQVKAKTRAMNSNDPRVPTYKGVIHQLCRVLVLLHKKDPVVSIPADAMGLLQWAQQMLEDHREQQSSSGGGGLPDLPVAQISAVDLDIDSPTSPVYATPDGSSQGYATPPQQSVASPYSSVPVPVTHTPYGPGRRSGFATISRTPSIPNGALILSLEENGTSVDRTPERQAQNSKQQPAMSTFLKKDFQNFLIHNGEKSEVRNVTGDSNSNKENNPGQVPNNEHINNISYTLSSSSPVETSTAFHSLPRTGVKSGLALAPTPDRHNRQSSAPDLGSSSGSVKKKNIITNPKIMKKSNPSQITKSVTSPSGSYFANGHFYDPNPMPATDVDVYAPGSSYSDRSNIMSTFLGDLPMRSRSPSIDSNDESSATDGSGGELDVFPFDPNEATDPVEV